MNHYADRSDTRSEGPGCAPSPDAPRPTVSASLREIAWACTAAAGMLRLADQFDPDLKRGRTTRRAMQRQAEHMVQAAQRAINLAKQFDQESAT